MTDTQKIFFYLAVLILIASQYSMRKVNEKNFTLTKEVYELLTIQNIAGI